MDKILRALEFIDQMRARGDQPGHDFADILQPLVEAYWAQRDALNAVREALEEV